MGLGTSLNTVFDYIVSLVITILTTIIGVVKSILPDSAVQAGLFNVVLVLIAVGIAFLVERSRLWRTRFTFILYNTILIFVVIKLIGGN